MLRFARVDVQANPHVGPMNRRGSSPRCVGLCRRQDLYACPNSEGDVFCFLGKCPSLSGRGPPFAFKPYDFGPFGRWRLSGS